MTAVINETCIENCCLVRGIFLVWEMSTFLLLGRILSPHVKGFSQTVGLSEGVEQSIYCRSNKQEERGGGDIFGMVGNTRSINREDNSAWHCFILKNLIPINFFK